MRQILMIEDDPSIVELASIHLKDIHCEMTAAYNGFEGLHLANTQNYDAIILDIMLPDIDGIEICKRIRAEKNFTPIIMLTARSEEIDKIIGLENRIDLCRVITRGIQTSNDSAHTRSANIINFYARFF